MFKNVLVTLDGSPVSEAVLPHVSKLVSGTSVEVTLLVMADSPAPIAGGVHVEPGRMVDMTAAGTATPATLETPSVMREGETQPQAEARIKDELDKYLRDKAAVLAGEVSQVETAVLFGDPAERIADYADEGGFDLIAMATHGRTGLARIVSGSVASRVLERAGRPVLLVRPADLRD